MNQKWKTSRSSPSLVTSNLDSQSKKKEAVSHLEVMYCGSGRSSDSSLMVNLPHVCVLPTPSGQYLWHFSLHNLTPTHSSRRTFRPPQDPWPLQSPTHCTARPFARSLGRILSWVPVEDDTQQRTNKPTCEAMYTSGSSSRPRIKLALTYASAGWSVSRNTILHRETDDIVSTEP
jgi:hypothetical protein